MRFLIGGLCLFLATACQSGGGSTEGGGSEQQKGNRLTLKKKEDRDFLNTVRSKGTREHVTKNMMSMLMKYGLSQSYSGVSERDVEETLNEITIVCERDNCYLEKKK